MEEIERSNYLARQYSAGHYVIEQPHNSKGLRRISEMKDRFLSNAWTISIMGGIVATVIGALLLQSGAIVPPVATTSTQTSPKSTLVAPLRMGQSASLPHQAVCHVLLTLSNANSQSTIVDRVSPIIYLGSKLLPFDKPQLIGSDNSVSYYVLFWDSTVPQGIRPDVRELVNSQGPGLLGAFASRAVAPFAVRNTESLMFEADFVLEAPTSPWMFYGRLYPLSDYREPSLPNERHVAVGFELETRDGLSIKTPLRSCSLFQKPETAQDLERTQPRIVTGE